VTAEKEPTIFLRYKKGGGGGHKYVSVKQRRTGKSVLAGLRIEWIKKKKNHNKKKQKKQKKKKKKTKKKKNKQKTRRR